MSPATQPVTNLRTLELSSGDQQSFRENYNIRPFAFGHQLSQHPLLQLSELRDLVQWMATTHPERLYYDVGDASVERGWDYTTKRSVSAWEVLENLEKADAWIILKGVHTFPEYKKLLDCILAEIHGVSQREYQQSIKEPNASIIITSPHRITPYHMDADCNYLLQVAGSKTVFVFDGSDKDVVTPRELERFYTGNINAAQYRESSQSKAWQFSLTPGRGVHIPVTFPHWVQNGSNVSISVSTNFFFVDRTVQDIYRINHYLRKIGLEPKCPGESAIRDRLKKFAAQRLRAVVSKHLS